MAEKKYYWLKLKRDFFKRHDIQILEATDNGKDYVLFYLKLLLESIDHDGNLRFSETIPYNEKMLSIITNTNIDVVKSAMEKLTALNLVEMMADSTIYMNEVEKMLGTETYWAEQKRKQRGNEPKLIGRCPQNVQLVQPLSNQELDIELDTDIDIKKDIPKNPIEEYTDNEKLRNTLKEFVSMRKKMKPGITDYGLKLILTKLDKISNGSDVIKVKILEQSIMGSYKGVFPIKEAESNGKPTTAGNTEAQIPDKYKNFYK